MSDSNYCTILGVLKKCFTDEDFLNIVYCRWRWLCYYSLHDLCLVGLFKIEFYLEKIYFPFGLRFWNFDIGFT